MKYFLLYVNIGLAISIIEFVFWKNVQGKESIEKMRDFINIGGTIAILFLVLIAFPMTILLAPIGFVARIINMPTKLIKKSKERINKMQYNAERRCTNCQYKTKGCSTWKDIKEEKTVSGWDLNRFATSCREYKETEAENE